METTVDPAMPGTMPLKKMPALGEPKRSTRLILVLAGIILGQIVLFGPSLVGQKVLLPLDLLAEPNMYIPRAPGIEALAKNGALADLVVGAEPARRFSISELRAGRLPMWAPYGYTGAPFLVPKFSPFLLLECYSESPLALAWGQMLVAIVAGMGAYVFFRRILGVSFWPAAICAWCYPLTGFFIFWQGFLTALAVCWLPWLLLAVDAVVRGTPQWRIIGLGLATCLVLISGQLDVAAQVLLISGLYGLWRLGETYFKQVPGWCARKAIVSLAAGWTLGFLLASPYFLPVLEYMHTGARMARRSKGEEERPPVGLLALPQTILPDMYGTSESRNLHYEGGGNQLESSSAAYAGVLATLVAAPLAFASRRHRSMSLLLISLSVLALGWCLNVPGLVTLLRLPGLNMMSHNRLVFVCCFTFLALASVGLDTLSRSILRWRSWMWLPLALLAILCAWCLFRTVRLPEPIATKLAIIVSRGERVGFISDMDGVRQVQGWFIQYYALAALLCGIGVLCWVLIRSGRIPQPVMVAIFGVLLVADLLWFGYDRNVQCDPSLYYPPVPALQAIAKATPGRIMGFNCLSPNLSAMCGVRDLRGYDAVDPARITDLILASADPKAPKTPYALTKNLAPKAKITPAGDIQLLPVLDMLSVRYVIFRGTPFPGAKPRFQSPDYWVLENPKALPRAFIPKWVEVVTNDALRLQKLTSDSFDPREVAYVEKPLSLPGPAKGAVEITNEIPTRVSTSVRMETPGLVVLADLWDKGWHAYLDGQSVPILRANHAVRGVVVPAGAHSLEFRYEPASFAWGLRLAALALIIMLALGGMEFWQTRKTLKIQPSL